ncbi:MAG: EAL domain-containing protein [Spirulina sp. SIO3F2]|nr:EAL domain-containing protein [Spirulina sp. SIO3F2]
MNRLRLHLRLSATQSFLSGAIALILVMGLTLLGITPFLENLAYTALFRLRGSQAWDERVVVIGIDEPTIAAFNALDWSRDLYSELLETLSISKPQAIGFNVLLNQSTADDVRLATAIAASAPVVLGVAWDSHGQLQAPPPPLQQAAFELGHLSNFIEAQGVIQQVKGCNQNTPSLSQAIAQILKLPTTTATDSFWVNWSGSLHSISTYSFVDVIERQIPPEVFTDKIVLVGMTALGFDPVRTPFDLERPASSVYVHAAVLSNLLQNQQLNPRFFIPSLGQWCGYSVLALGLSMLLYQQQGRSHPLRSQLSLGLGAFCVWIGLGVLALSANYLLPLAAPLFLLGLTTAICLIQGEIQARQKFMQRVDPITRLPNRLHLLQTLQQQLKKAAATQRIQYWGLVLIDIDRFTMINAYQGHTVGNQVLQEIAERLRRLKGCSPIVKTIAHLGADEFSLLLQLPNPEPSSVFLNQLTEITQAPFRLTSGQVLFWHVSLGIALLSNTSDSDPQMLLRHAEVALCQARLQDQSNYAIFNAQLHQGAIALWQLELDLHQSLSNVSSTTPDWGQDLARSGFYLDYQPIICLQTQQIKGFEALVRWHHPQRGMLSPEEFIPLAESTGLIRLLGQWVLYRACYQLQAWRMAFPQYPDLMMTVNVSPIQLLSQDVLAQVRAVLEITGLASQHLKLEITESQLMANGERAIQLLQALQNLGVSLSLDDFGMGYSSLNRLKTLPINILKIDRSFVHQLAEVEPNRTMVHVIVELAQQLNLQVVAEGIETANQFEQLQGMGVNYGQGYWFARPLTVQAAEQFLANLEP